VEWLLGHPVVVGVAAALVLLLVVATAIRSRTGTLDPVRMYSSQQRIEGFARAGNRCELDGWLPGLRCRRPAQHGDHHHPWSKGGATSMNNFVAACATCNMSKSNRMPAFWQGWLIARRRRRYFPAGVRRRPGERYV
jgi:5-methylcytosine-specific restriction endonuclease McrA